MHCPLSSPPPCDSRAQPSPGRATVPPSFPVRAVTLYTHTHTHSRAVWLAVFCYHLKPSRSEHPSSPAFNVRRVSPPDGVLRFFVPFACSVHSASQPRVRVLKLQAKTDASRNRGFSLPFFAKRANILINRESAIEAAAVWPHIS